MKTLLPLMSQRIGYIKSIRFEQIIFRYGQLIASLLAIAILGYLYIAMQESLGAYFESLLNGNVPQL